MSQVTLQFWRNARHHRGAALVLDRHGNFYRHAIFCGHHVTHHVPVHTQVIGQVFTLEQGVDNGGVFIDYRRVTLVVQRRVRFQIDARRH